MNSVLVCDVDGVVVDLEYAWYTHIINLHADPEDAARRFPFSDVQYDYDFRKIAPHGLSYEAMAFWNADSLYDECKPIPGAVDALREVSKAGIHLVFCSQVEGSHSKSKFNFLKDNFPFMDGFMATREKHWARASGMVDDLEKNLINFPDHTLKFLYRRPHNHAVENPNIHVLSSWQNLLESGGIANFIDDLKKVKV